MINTIKLRKWIGWFGIALPLIVLVLSLLFGPGIPDSISATYFIPACITPFMIILGAAGLLLICYTGYEKKDNIICTLTGFLGWGICLFPCNALGLATKWTFLEGITRVGTFQISVAISGMIHNLCAIGFFLLLAYNSLFLFTKTNGSMTKNKRKRNIIFRICGIGMILSLICIVPVSIFEIWGGTWLVETIALGFFGISWLTKANCYSWLFAD